MLPWKDRDNKKVECAFLKILDPLGTLDSIYFPQNVMYTRKNISIVNGYIEITYMEGI